MWNLLWNDGILAILVDSSYVVISYVDFVCIVSHVAVVFSFSISVNEVGKAVIGGSWMKPTSLL